VEIGARNNNRIGFDADEGTGGPGDQRFQRDVAVEAVAAADVEKRLVLAFRQMLLKIYLLHTSQRTPLPCFQFDEEQDLDAASNLISSHAHEKLKLCPALY